MKNLKIAALFFLIQLLATRIDAQLTMTLQTSKDAAIGFHDGAGTAGNNYGGAIQNAAYMVPAVASPTGYNGNRALIDFNLGSIPANAVLISAHLNLYALGPFGSVSGHFGNANASYLERVTQAWGEYTVTWNNQPPSVTQNQVTLNQSMSPTQDYLNINVTALVQDMLSNPSSSFGFKLRLVNEVSYNGLAFASRDHSNPSKHPNLIITYNLCNDSMVNKTATLVKTICKGSSITLTAQPAVSYTWTISQQVIGQGASIVVSPTINTTYVLNWTDANGCKNATQFLVLVKDCNGIKEMMNNGKMINIYPNPNAGIFSIESSSPDQKFDKIEITDLQGKSIKIIEPPLAQSSIEIRDLQIKPGVYFCRVLSAGETLRIYKILVTN